MATITATPSTPPHRSHDADLERSLADELFGPDLADLIPEQSGSQSEPEAAAAAAWSDPDDDDVRVDLTTAAITKKLRRSENETLITGREYSARLRMQFQKLHPRPDWASKTAGSDDDDDDDEFAYLHTNEPLLATDAASGRGLTSGRIRLTRMKDANHEAPSDATIQSVRFHRDSQLLLTAGMDKTLHLFHIAGQTNARLRQVHISDLPMFAAEFVADGSQVWLAGPRPFFYVYDMEAGRVDKVSGIRGRPDKSFRLMAPSPDGKTVAFLCQDGYVAFISTRSKQCIGTVRANGDLRSLQFNDDGTELYSLTHDGQVLIWDVGSRRCRRRHHDVGCTKATQIAARGSMFATGMGSGVVNLYTDQDPGCNPMKSFMSLTAPIDSLTFNHDGQLLAMSSKMKKDALRLVHVPSRTVLRSWPTSQTPLHYVSSVDFSPDSRYLAIGNDRGRVLLYSLGQYQQ